MRGELRRGIDRLEVVEAQHVFAEWLVPRQVQQEGICIGEGGDGKKKGKTLPG